MRQFITLLFDSKQKKGIIILLFLSVILAILEAVGVGAVLPFVTMLQSPYLIEGISWISSIKNLLNINDSDSFVLFFGFALLGMFIAKNLLAVIQISYLHQFTQEFYRKLSTRLLTSYMAHPYLFFLQSNSSVLTKNVTMETKLIAEQIVEPGILIFSETLVLLLILAVLMFYEPVLSLVSLFFMFLLLGCIYLFSTKYSRRYGKEREQTFSQMTKISNEALSGIKDIKISGTEKFFIKLFDSIIQKNSRANALNSIFQQIPKIVIETVMVTFLLGIILYSKVFLKGPESIIATLAMYLAAGYRIMPSVNKIITSIMRLRYIEAGFKVIAPSLYTALQVEDINSKLIKDLQFKNKILLSNIHFRYPENEHDVLGGINIEIIKGDIVGFIGESGVGKSTLFNVMLGLLGTRKGQIYIDNFALKNEEDIRSWQNLISYVPQQVFIIDDTLAHNIALGIPDGDIDWDKIDKAVETAQLSDFVRELPKGIHTILGDRGAKLSGGQIQRIGIARALYRDKPVLILDEATNALDDNTEEQFIQALYQESQNRTVLIIAHRYTSLKYCNRIYRIKNGKILECLDYYQLTSERIKQ